MVQENADGEGCAEGQEAVGDQGDDAEVECTICLTDLGACPLLAS